MIGLRLKEANMTSEMARRILIGIFAISLFLTGGFVQVATAQAQGNAAAGLSVDDVVAMVKAGLGDDVVILAIRKEEKAFDLGALELVKLKQAGVSDDVLKVMLDPMAEIDSDASAVTSGNSTQDSTGSATGPLPPDAEIGVYTKKKGEWVELLPEVVNWKTGGILKRMATAGIMKGDVNGFLDSPSSRNTVVTPVEFIIYMPEGIAITEYQLLRLRQNKDYREFRTVTGGIMHAKGGAMRDLVPFEGKKVASRMYEVVLPSNLGAGEYGFLPPGAFNSANAASALGKLFSFRILE
jgi:hypothetical protein